MQIFFDEYIKLYFYTSWFYYENSLWYGIISWFFETAAHQKKNMFSLLQNDFKKSVKVSAFNSKYLSDSKTTWKGLFRRRFQFGDKDRRTDRRMSSLKSVQDEKSINTRSLDSTSMTYWRLLLKWDLIH